MTIGLPRSGLLLLILACTVRAALAQAPAAPLQYADDFAELGQSATDVGRELLAPFGLAGYETMEELAEHFDPTAIR